MSCNYPMLRAETYETYKNKKGGISYKAEFLQRDLMDTYKNNIQGLRKTFNGKYRRIDIVGCGQCTPCLLGYAADRATQIMMHKKYGYHEVFNEEGKPLDTGHEYPEGTTWFLTCTYSDEYLPTAKTVNTETGEINEGISLLKDDHKNFVKRLRNHYPDIKISYVVAGEYGSKSLRPHYHFCIFGLPLEQEEFKKVGMNAWNQPTWESKKLSNIWGMGYVNIGRLDWESAAYVARYTLKKANKKDTTWYQMQGMIPEYIAWSNGIGKDFFIENYKTIYSTDSVPITRRKGGILKPPKSYDRMLKEIDPELYEEIKRKRDYHSIISEQMKNNSTDMTPEERRAISEARMKQVIKDIRTEV